MKRLFIAAGLALKLALFPLAAHADNGPQEIISAEAEGVPAPTKALLFMQDGNVLAAMVVYADNGFSIVSMIEKDTEVLYQMLTLVQRVPGDKQYVMVLPSPKSCPAPGTVAKK